MFDRGPPEPEDRHARVLARVAALSLELAENLQARALAAETGAEAAELAEAFHKVTRGLRQTLALDMRFIRFRKELDRQAPDYELRQTAARTAAECDAAARRSHEDQVRERVEPAIWNEHEYDEARVLQIRLRRWLRAAAERPDFLEGAVEALVEQACRALGLDPETLYAGADAEPAEASGVATAREPPALPVRRLNGSEPPDSS